MSIPLIIRPEAEADLADAHRWYEGQREGLGDEFLLCFEACLAFIQRNPQAFSLLYQEARRALVRRFPYGVFYVLTPARIAVIAVLHLARDPDLWRGRIDDASADASKNTGD
jgi:plasmid stabilization system protein ParE